MSYVGTLGGMLEHDRQQQQRRVLRKIDGHDDIVGAPGDDAASLAQSIEQLREQCATLLQSVTHLSGRAARSLSHSERMLLSQTGAEIGKKEMLAAELAKRLAVLNSESSLSKATQSIGRQNAIDTALERRRELLSEIATLPKQTSPTTIQKLHGGFGTGHATVAAPHNSATARRRAELLHNVSEIEVALAELGVSV